MVQDKLTDVMMINQPKGEGGMPIHHDAIKLFIKMIMSQTIGRNQAEYEKSCYKQEIFSCFLQQLLMALNACTVVNTFLKFNYPSFLLEFKRDSTPFFYSVRVFFNVDWFFVDRHNCNICIEVSRLLRNIVVAVSQLPKLKRSNKIHDHSL